MIMTIAIIILALNICICTFVFCMLHHNVTKISNDVQGIIMRMDIEKLEELYKIRQRLEKNEQYEEAAKVSEMIYKIEQKYKGKIQLFIEKRRPKY